MVFAEMTCVSPDARITPGCPGLWNDAQRDAWRRIVDFVHARDRREDRACSSATPARKGSTCVPWAGGEDRAACRGQLAARVRQRAAVSRRHVANGAARRRATTWTRISDDFVAATRRAAEAGFDWLELHCAHGYLLSSFHLAAHQPARRRVRRRSLAEPLPLSARGVRGDPRRVARGQADQRAHLGARLGGGRHHARTTRWRSARLFKAAGADMMDCSSGQVVPDAKPVYGRMYQTPFADRIRNEAGIATIAVGAIFEADHANGIIAARPRRPLRDCAPASRESRVDADRSGEARLSEPCRGRSSTCPRRHSSERNLQREKEAAAANAGLTPQQIAAKLLDS